MGFGRILSMHIISEISIVLSILCREMGERGKEQKGWRLLLGGKGKQSEKKEQTGQGDS